MRMKRSKKHRVLVLGGRGFVGRAIAAALKEHSIYTFDRHPGGKRHIQGSITSFSDLLRACQDKDCVINLIGLTPLKHHKESVYAKAHVQGVKHVLRACKQQNVKRLIHMSVLGARKAAPTAFLRTKGQGEALVLRSGLQVTVFCPSLIYDTQNELICSLKKSMFTHFFPNIQAKIQPIYRRDIARLFQLAVGNKIKERKLEIGGPASMSLYAFAKQFYRAHGYTCYPFPLVFFRFLLSLATFFPFTRVGQDQLTSLSLDNITTHNKAPKYVSLTPYATWLKRVA